MLFCIEYSVTKNLTLKNHSFRLSKSPRRAETEVATFLPETETCYNVNQLFF